MRENIERILSRAIWAPSGDNVQPWSFIMENNTLRVFNNGSDNSFYNHRQVASIMAIGALIENIRLAASAEHIMAQVTAFPRKEDSSHVASIVFDGHAEPDPLHQWIEKRASNRRPYDSIPLPADVQRTLKDSTSKINGVRVAIIAGEAKDRVATLSSINERVVLENRAMRDFFFKHITWTNAEDEEHPGFFVDTLELASHQRFVFQLYSRWPLARAFNAIGLSRVIANENAVIYRSSSVIVAFVINDTSLEYYLRAGIALQRFWLTACSLSLAVQPLAGIPFLSGYVSATGGPALTVSHREMIKTAYDETVETFKLGIGTIAIMLRVGMAPPPTARTRRAPPRMQRV